MSLPSKEVRPFICPTSHEQLSIMADYMGMGVAELASMLLERGIAGEWHRVRLLIKRSERLGKRRRALEEGEDFT